jgi:Arc/MetJ family transcription regulator
MAKTAKLKRKSFFVDEETLATARRILRVSSDGEAIRLSLERAAEMERFWRLMEKSRWSVEPGSFGDS